MLTIKNSSFPDVPSLISPFSIVGNADGDRQEKALTSNLPKTSSKSFHFPVCVQRARVAKCLISQRKKSYDSAHKIAGFFIQFVSVFFQLLF
jgi:hypothetical protein